MEEVLKVLRSGTLWVGTVDGGRPAVRPFGAAIDFEGALYLFTANTKAVYRQIMANPRVEIAVMLNESRWARVRAEAYTEANDEVVAAFLDDDPNLATGYTVGDGIGTPLRLEKIEVVIYNEGEIVEKY
jgi:uncharacterized pyridoxamine 5'-phosphate oxidase family protein